MAPLEILRQAFRPKWQLAVEQITQLTGEGVPTAPVVANAGYGVTTALREALTARGISTARVGLWPEVVRVLCAVTETNNNW